jgi:hypothetical protein
MAPDSSGFAAGRDDAPGCLRARADGGVPCRGSGRPVPIVPRAANRPQPRTGPSRGPAPAADRHRHQRRTRHWAQTGTGRDTGTGREPALSVLLCLPVGRLRSNGGEKATWRGKRA